ncbi:60S ribosomal protein L27, mitochondrial [Entomophthora muscae]|uniref:60S ribosomal protein L27, mitochondrial n=1 Tax=Entomophthora muscae TaxID=34485 RepID=A0ACC2SZN2_9FUNG|nr:60S ribosomal protein L27, mitochondrial [Entomophthora muscae]
MFNITKLIPRGAFREPMIRKRGHNYYKGTRVGSTGSHTKHGQYIIDQSKVRKYVVPDLEGFELTPYVSHRTPRIWQTCKAEDFLKSA